MNTIIIFLIGVAIGLMIMIVIMQISNKKKKSIRREEINETIKSLSRTMTYLKDL